MLGAFIKTMAKKGLEGMMVRYRGSEVGCVRCLRITGTEEKNAIALTKLKKTLESMPRYSSALKRTFPKSDQILDLPISKSVCEQV